MLRYAAVLLAEREKAAAYRIYVTDCLKLITENTARTGGGSYMKARYAEVERPAVVDKRTGEEIMADTLSRLGIRLE
jgi:hypothetical protein